MGSGSSLFAILPILLVRSDAPCGNLARVYGVPAGDGFTASDAKRAGLAARGLGCCACFLDYEGPMTVKERDRLDALAAELAMPGGHYTTEGPGEINAGYLAATAPGAFAEYATARAAIPIPARLDPGLRLYRQPGTALCRWTADALVKVCQFTLTHPGRSPWLFVSPRVETAAGKLGPLSPLVAPEDWRDMLGVALLLARGTGGHVVAYVEDGIDWLARGAYSDALVAGAGT